MPTNKIKFGFLWTTTPTQHLDRKPGETFSHHRVCVCVTDAFVPYLVMTDLVSAKKCCGCSARLHWSGPSSRDLTVCGPTGRNSGPSLQYFAPGNRSHNFGTYRRKSVTMVPSLKEINKTERQLVTHLAFFYWLKSWQEKNRRVR